MEHRLSNYSPNILIYLKIDDKIIRLSDVLCQTATLHSNDFEDIAPGTMADLIFSVDKKETKKTIILSEGLRKDMGLFSFKETLI
jgi:hypothetical protein